MSVRGERSDGGLADIAVLLVDDQDLVRSGLRRILRRKDGFVVVAECSDGDEVLDALAEQSVDVVVMDLRMKRVDGIEATRRLAEAGGPPVLALTTFNEDDLLSGVLRAGAAGFVLKDSSAEELIRATLAEAAKPRPPWMAAPRSVRISPNRLEATTTSRLSGCITKRAPIASIW